VAKESKPKTASKKAPAKKPAAKKKAAPKKAPAKKTTAEKSKGGRPTDYREEYNEQAYKLYALGHGDLEVAKFLGVSKATINNWKLDYEQFLDSVTRGRDEYDDRTVEVSFRKRAVGYRYEEKVTEYDDNGNVKGTRVMEKEALPDPGAAMNWLSNRQRKKWSKITTNENRNINIDLNNLDDEELDRKLKMLEAE
jgi:uncharacterized protein YjcR